MEPETFGYGRLKGTELEPEALQELAFEGKHEKSGSSMVFIVNYLAAKDTAKVYV